VNLIFTKVEKLDNIKSMIYCIIIFLTEICKDTIYVKGDRS
jgi:hypothetical protein